MGNLFKSGQLVETQITFEIEDEEAASSVVKVHRNDDQRSYGCRHEARNCVASTTPCGIWGRCPYRRVLINGVYRNVAQTTSGQKATFR
jgi:hypothetical protein